MVSTDLQTHMVSLSEITTVNVADNRSTAYGRISRGWEPAKAVTEGGRI